MLKIWKETDLRAQLLSEIDRKMIELGKLLEKKPQKTAEILKSQCWLINLKEDLELPGGGYEFEVEK